MADEKVMRASIDPVDWMVLADMLEERSEYTESTRWREMADLAKSILPLWVEVAYSNIGTEVELLGGSPHIETTIRRTRHNVITCISGDKHLVDVLVRSSYIEPLGEPPTPLFPGVNPKRELTVKEKKYIRDKLWRIYDITQWVKP